jgi:hypothetical protein
MKRTSVANAVLTAITLSLLAMPAHSQSSMDEALAMQRRAESAPPWRMSDSTIINICFDGLDRSAPEVLQAQDLTDISAGSSTPELVSFTTTDRPIYQVSSKHPVHFRGLILKLPGTDVYAVIRPPKDLKPAVDGWVEGPTPAECTTSRMAFHELLNNKGLSSAMACPDLGIRTLFNVKSRSEFTYMRIVEKPRGVRLSNGLRGCREFIYPQTK